MKSSEIKKELNRDISKLVSLQNKSFKLKLKRFILAWKILAKWLYLYRFLIITLMLGVATIFVAIPNMWWIVMNAIVHFPNWETTIVEKAIPLLYILSLDMLFYTVRTSAILAKKSRKKKCQHC